MKKKRKKSSKPAQPVTINEMPAPTPATDERVNPYGPGILPDRDLKKNLGCG